MTAAAARRPRDPLQMCGVASFGTILSYLPMPVGASLAGSALALLHRPSARLESAVQHFAAGAILAGVAVELVPELRDRRPLLIALGWLIGLVVMLLIRRTVASLERAAGDASLSLVYVAAADVFIDGFLFSIGFGAGHHAGVILAIALSIEALFLALTVTAAAASSPRRRLLTPIGLAGLLASGALLGGLLVSAISGTGLTLILAFGAVALLYLVVEELLVEAHETADTAFAISLFFAAFLLLLLLERA